jgi:uncharacterized membrane protein YphA (DoxX/SURF4 family)
MDDQSPEDRVAGWALRFAVAVIFVVTGLEKFSSSPTSYWIGLFEEIGLGQWFRVATGVIEILGGVLFLFPPLTLAAAGILVMTMLGAVAVHVFVFKHPGNAFIPAAYLIGVLLVTGKVRGGRGLTVNRARKG